MNDIDPKNPITASLDVELQIQGSKPITQRREYAPPLVVRIVTAHQTGGNKRALATTEFTTGNSIGRTIINSSPANPAQ